MLWPGARGGEGGKMGETWLALSAVRAWAALLLVPRRVLPAPVSQLESTHCPPTDTSRRLCQPGEPMPSRPSPPSPSGRDRGSGRSQGVRASPPVPKPQLPEKTDKREPKAFSLPRGGGGGGERAADVQGKGHKTQSPAVWPLATSEPQFPCSEHRAAVPGKGIT